MAERSEKLSFSKVGHALIGREGSGKTTIARALAEDLGKPYVSTGDTLRYLAANDPGPLGDECRKMFEEHVYLSGQSLLKVLATRFVQADVKNGFVLDGGFRTVEETRGLPRVLKEFNRNSPLIVFYLDIPEKLSFERLNKRGRGDDNEAAIARRLAEFCFKLDYRLNLIKAQPSWELVPIDATRSPQDVYKDVYQAASKA